MEIRTTYIGTIDGIKVIVNGDKPENMIVEETKQVLYPASGYVLKRISDNTQHACVVLEDGDTMENYTDVERERPTPRRRNDSN